MILHHALDLGAVLSTPMQRPWLPELPWQPNSGLFGTSDNDQAEYERQRVAPGCRVPDPSARRLPDELMLPPGYVELLLANDRVSLIGSGNHDAAVQRVQFLRLRSNAS